MTEQLESLKQARVAFVEAKIALRKAQFNYDEAKTAFVAGTDYKSLGSNNDIRDQKLADKILASPGLARLRKILHDAQDAYDRAEVALEQWLDERRHAESVTWAKLADYLEGKADHVHYAPTQAAQRVLVDEMTGEIIGELSDDGETLYEIVEDEDSDDIPF